MKYELAIAHRVCPVLAKTASHFTDKFEMVKSTTASLANAIDRINTKLVVILDGCPDEYGQLFDDTFSKMDGIDYERISTPAIGNFATYGKQMEILSKCADDAKFLYFSEDDYIYHKEAFRAMMDFLERPEVDFVTPLDHPDRYGGITPEQKRVQILVSKYCHWREVGTTCCTFMTTSETFLVAKELIAQYGKGSGDGSLWIGLTKHCIFSIKDTIGAAFRYLTGRRKSKEGLEFIVLGAWLWHKWRLPFGKGYRLWGPIPTLAVHLCVPSLPPFADILMKGKTS